MRYGSIEYNPNTLHKYFESGTFLAEYDGSGIKFLCLFSINGDTLEVDEVTVRPDIRSFKTIKYATILAIKKFPFINKISFERLRKYPERKVRTYDIYSFLGIKGVKK